jgi:DNA/RNA-binding domain of Phe-tRNA-synthetase-like protein
MDDILWMRTGNTYWLFLKGQLISGRTTNYRSANDLIVTDTQTNVIYILYDYFSTPDNQLKTAYKTQQK